MIDGSYYESTIKLKGNVDELKYGTEYKVICDAPIPNEKYGNTYPIVYMSSYLDVTVPNNQRIFLSSFLSETMIDNLFAKYDNVLELFQTGDINKLLEVKGIGESTAKNIIKKYNAMEGYSEVFVALSNCGLTNNLITTLMEHYKSPDKIKRIIETDPYALVEVKGIGFRKADEIALNNGVDPLSVNRIKGALLYVLNENGNNGKTYEYGTVLINQLYGLLDEINMDNLGKAIQELKDTNKIKVFSDHNLSNDSAEQKIALTKFIVLENNIGSELYRLATADKLDCFKQTINVEECIHQVEEKQGFEFTDEQRHAIESTLNSNVTILTGLAGAGKTATANGIFSLYPNCKKIGVALSGKASLRINESTGINSYTIHKALQYQHGKFMVNKDNKLWCDILLIDEATMINGELFYSLLSSVKSGAKVIIMGDVQQLPAIGSCQVFYDLLNVPNLNVIKLTKPHRQALESGIIPTSINVANQLPIFKDNYTGNTIVGNLQDLELDIYNESSDLDAVVVDAFMKQLSVWKDINEVQVITSMKIKGNVSCYNLNNMIQAKLNLNEDVTRDIVVQRNKDSDDLIYTLHVGDKVINSKNNYNCEIYSDFGNFENDDNTTEEPSTTSIFNGSMGIITDIKDDFIVVDFTGIDTVKVNNSDLESLSLGYAITIHKSQGSGFKSVIVVITSGSYIMNNSELLYTALTRAEKYCMLIGENKAISHAIKTKEGSKKQTLLCKILNTKFKTL